MNNNKIKEVILQKTEDLIELSSRISPDFDKKTIHDFRVTFKYLRSFLRLIRIHNQEKGLKLPDNIKRIYSITGLIRDAQLEKSSSMVKDMASSEYYALLEKTIESQKREWEKHYSKKVMQKFLKKAENYQFEDLPEGILANFFKTKIETIEHNIAGILPTDEQIHNVRKQVKDIVYTSDIAGKKSFNDAKAELKDATLQDLKTVAEEIGTYNDERQQLVRMNSFSEQAEEQEEKNRIEQLKTRAIPKLKNHKKTIIGLIKQMLHKN